MLLKIIKSPINFMKYFLIGLKTTLIIIPKYFIVGIQCILDKKKREKMNFNNSLIPTTITTLSLITYFISIFLLTRWYVQNERIKKFSDSIADQTIIAENEEKNIKDSKDNYKELTGNSKYSLIPANLNYLNIDFNYYLSKNPETVAFIQINGTNISYPITKHSDNDFYLNHDFYKRKSVTGWIFVDYRNDFQNLSNNTIIYGHNLINRTMFGYLPKILKNNWFDTELNRYVKISTPTYNSIWQIFSIYKIQPTTDYLRTKFNSTLDYDNFLQKLKNRSNFNFNVNLTYEDKIITLSTCDDTGTQRVVLHAKLYSIENTQ